MRDRGIESKLLVTLQPPKSVILLAHSMGGFVARAALTVSSFQPGSVNTIITLNTPHRIAPAYLHHSTATLYHSVNHWWVEQFKKIEEGEKTGIIIVAIATAIAIASSSSSLVIRYSPFVVHTPPFAICRYSSLIIHDRFG